MLGRHWNAMPGHREDFSWHPWFDVFFNDALPQPRHSVEDRSKRMDCLAHACQYPIGRDWLGEEYDDWWEKPEELGAALGDRLHALDEVYLPGAVHAWVGLVGAIDNSTPDWRIMQYASFQNAWIDRMHKLGLKTVAVENYTGNVLDRRRWQMLGDVARKSDYLGVQCYYGPWGDFMLNDVDAVHEYLDGKHAPILVAECGYAHGGDLDVGRKRDGISDSDFIGTMRRFTEGLWQRREWVAGAAVFGYHDDGSGHWVSFDEYGGSFEAWRSDFTARLALRPQEGNTMADQYPTKEQFDHLRRAVGWMLLGNYTNAVTEWNAENAPGSPEQIDPAKVVDPNHPKA